MNLFCDRLAARIVASRLDSGEEPTNEDRAEWAAIAIDTFAHTVGNVSERNHEDDETNAADLLADMVHWCNARGLDFAALVERGQAVAAEEIAEESANLEEN